MPICMGIGEAAGIAAALSVKQYKKVRDVNVKDVQKILREQIWLSYSYRLKNPLRKDERPVFFVTKIV